MYCIKMKVNLSPEQVHISLLLKAFNLFSFQYFYYDTDEGYSRNVSCSLN
jgi:hypothetical protein